MVKKFLTQINEEIRNIDVFPILIHITYYCIIDERIKISTWYDNSTNNKYYNNFSKDIPCE
jgi:hypothetical protein